jgi:hypothetical protein
MAWTTPKDWTTDELVTASDMNTHVRDNLNHLFSPPGDNYECNESSDYSAAPSSFADIDSTNLALTLTPSGDTVMIGFHGNISKTTGRVFLDVAYGTSSRVGGDDGVICTSNGADREPVSFVRILTGLTPDTECTFKLQWKVSNTGDNATLFAGAGTTNGDLHPQFWVRELG